MDKEDRDFFNIQKGIKYENAGKEAKAIKVYENLIAENFDGSHPYDRLCVIYRKQKNFAAEKCVLEKAISVFTQIAASGRPDGPPKLERYKKRLDIVHKKMLK